MAKLPFLIVQKYDNIHLFILELENMKLHCKRSILSFITFVPFQVSFLLSVLMFRLCNGRVLIFTESDQPVDMCFSVSAIRPGAGVNMNPLQDLAVLFEEQLR